MVINYKSETTNRNVYVTLLKHENKQQILMKMIFTKETYFFHVLCVVTLYKHIYLFKLCLFRCQKHQNITKKRAKYWFLSKYYVM